MGTKANPGPYDCYAKAEPDEPIFTLRAKDPVASNLVAAWVALRAGDFKGALRAIMDADHELAKSGRQYLVYGSDKSTEAQKCAMAMEIWRKQRELDALATELRGSKAT